MTTPLHIDGSEGEGGGQILRSALALSIVTGRPFRIERIRAKRSKPGLLRQHLTAVQAAASISGAQVAGDAIASTELDFRPGPVRPGHYRFAIGTAGSAALVLQTVLPPLLMADGPSTLELEGGTHNPSAPPYDFLAGAFAPLLQRMGGGLALALERRGFFPAGGGRFTAHITPPGTGGWQRLQLDANPGPLQRRATAILSALPRSVGERELKALQSRLDLQPEHCHIVDEPNPRGPGNALVLEVAGRELTEVFVAFGERSVSSEQVAEQLIQEERAYVASGAAVGAHLGDQLMLPLALGAGGSYTTADLTQHARSNADIIQRFLPVRIGFEEEAGGRCWRVTVVV